MLSSRGRAGRVAGSTYSTYPSDWGTIDAVSPGRGRESGRRAGAILFLLPPSYLASITGPLKGGQHLVAGIREGVQVSLSGLNLAVTHLVHHGLQIGAAGE